jgi:hypothetical protein
LWGAIGDGFRLFDAHCLPAASFSQFTNENARIFKAKDSNPHCHHGPVALLSSGPLEVLEIPMVMKHNDIYKCQISIVFKETSVKAIYGPLQPLNGGYCPVPGVIK